MRAILRSVLRPLLAVAAVGGFVALMTWPSLSRVVDANRRNARFDRRFAGWRAAGELAPAERESLLRALSAALKDPDGPTRMRAGYALARIGPSAEAAVPALVEAVASREREDRAGATAGLEGIAALNVPPSVQVAQTPDAADWRARKALLSIGTPEALAAAARFPDSCPAVLRVPVDWCR